MSKTFVEIDGQVFEVVNPEESQSTGLIKFKRYKIWFKFESKYCKTRETVLSRLVERKREAFA